MFDIPANNNIKKLWLTRVFFSKYCVKCTYLRGNLAIVITRINTRIKNVG